MQRAFELTGKTFGELTVLRREGADKQGAATWRCRCSCGREKTIRGYHLRTAVRPTRSCGECDTLKPRRLNLIGRVFHRLTVERYMFTHGFAFWRCRCSCGNVHVASSSSLLRGTVKSCGCYRRDYMAKKMFKPELTAKDRRKWRSGNIGDSFRKIAQRVLARDAFTCRACGGGGMLAAHHILPWHAHPEYRYSPRNLVTLCACCHSDFHALYGFDCDLDDLEEFLNS